MDQLKFRISAALKNIIGKELITNKYVAIFELVKNAYDASAGKVEVIFKDDQIVIRDNGKGMSLSDITDKWLFVGYSAKADDSENDGYVNYRNKIQTRKAFAGAKGIGRFACDRLGSKLKLITKKDSASSKIEELEVEWNAFEEDPKTEFIEIDVNHRTVEFSADFQNDVHGTVLIVSDLREDWNSDDIAKLKRHLARLINPQTDKQDIFDIFLEFDGYEERIDNFIFERLGIKTTKICVEITDDGKFVSTELIDRGERIYKILEKNDNPETLYGISFNLFYLNQPAKVSFKAGMGITTSEYGSISLYKNGFRVFPFGEPGEDLLGLDRRKSQGFARYLGTRELLGVINIDNDSPEFRETSSRDGGLIETQGYKDLKITFVEKCLKRLETYVVDALSWTFDEGGEIFPGDKVRQIHELLEKLTKSKNYIDFEYGFRFDDFMRNLRKSGYQGAKEELLEEVKRTGNKKLELSVKKIERTLERKEEEVVDVRNRLERSEEQNASLRVFLENPFLKNIAGYHHNISIATKNIKRYIDSSLLLLKEAKYDDLEYALVNIGVETEKINSISKIATRSGIRDGAHKKNMSVNEKVEDYAKDYLFNSGKLKIEFRNSTTGDYVTSFRYFDLVTIIDNLVDNSAKNGANKLIIELFGDEKSLEIIFTDDGRGLDSKFLSNVDEIFEPRVSTTNGSGWGLTQVRDILNQMKGGISVHPLERGLMFKVTFPVGK